MYSVRLRPGVAGLVTTMPGAPMVASPAVWPAGSHHAGGGAALLIAAQALRWGLRRRVRGGR